MKKKEVTLDLIDKGLSDFCDEYLNPYAEKPFKALCSAVAESEELDVIRGKPEVWVAGIAYAFCRMNFLLDGGSPGGVSLSRDEFFLSLKSAIDQRSLSERQKLNGP